MKLLVVLLLVTFTMCSVFAQDPIEAYFGIDDKTTASNLDPFHGDETERHQDPDEWLPETPIAKPSFEEPSFEMPELEFIHI